MTKIRKSGRHSIDPFLSSNDRDIDYSGNASMSGTRSCWKTILFSEKPGLFSIAALFTGMMWFSKKYKYSWPSKKTTLWCGHPGCLSKHSISEVIECELDACWGEDLYHSNIDNFIDRPLHSSKICVSSAKQFFRYKIFL